MTASPLVATAVACNPPLAADGPNLREYRPFIEKNIREMFKDTCSNRYARNVAMLVSDVEVLPFEIDKVVLACRNAQCEGRKTVTEKDYAVATLQLAGEMGMSQCRRKKQSKRPRHDVGDTPSPLSLSLPPVVKSKKPKVEAIKKPMPTGKKQSMQTAAKPKKTPTEAAKKRAKKPA